MSKRKIESIKELREICQRSEANRDSWYDVNFFRKISIYFTKLLLKTKITANQTSGIAISIGIIAGVFFVFGNYWYAFIGALLLCLSYIFDCVDGEIARYRKSATIAGKYVESMYEYIIYPFIFICISIGLYNLFNNIFILILGILIALFMCWGNIASNLVYTVLVIETKNSTNKIVDKQVSEISENIRKRHSKIRRIYNYIKIWFTFPVPLVLITTILDILFINYCPDYSVDKLAIEFRPNIVFSIFNYGIEFNFLYIYFFLFVIIISSRSIIRIIDNFNQLKSYSK